MKRRLTAGIPGWSGRDSAPGVFVCVWMGACVCVCVCVCVIDVTNQWPAGGTHVAHFGKQNAIENSENKTNEMQTGGVVGFSSWATLIALVGCGAASCRCFFFNIFPLSVNAGSVSLTREDDENQWQGKWRGCRRQERRIGISFRSVTGLDPGFLSACPGFFFFLFFYTGVVASPCRLNLWRLGIESELLLISVDLFGFPFLIRCFCCCFCMLIGLLIGWVRDVLEADASRRRQSGENVHEFGHEIPADAADVVTTDTFHDPGNLIHF